jgi:hypothetical protein
MLMWSLAGIVAVSSFALINDAGLDARTSASTDAESLFEVLSDTSPADSQPATKRELRPDSARLLYFDQSGSFWLAVDTKGWACLIVELAHSQAGVDPVVAMACDPPTRVAELGITLDVYAFGEGVDVTAFPDEWMSPQLTSAIEAAGGRAVGGNLAVFELGGRPRTLLVDVGDIHVDVGSDRSDTVDK